jgi:O-antigen/teichoic acid export membrane protein
MAINFGIATVLLIAWLYSSPMPDAERFYYLLMLLHLAGQLSLFIYFSRVQLEEKFRVIAIWQVAQVGIRLFLLLLIFLLGLSITIETAIFAYVFTGLALLAYTLRPIIEMSNGLIDLKGHGEKKNSLSTDLSSISSVYKRSWPFGLAVLFQLIFFKSDIVLVRYLSGPSEAGYYNVAYNFLLAALLLPMVIYQTYLPPKIHRWAYSNRNLFYKVYKQGSIFMLIAGALSMIAMWIFTPYLIPLLFGIEFKPAIEVIFWLAISTPFLFMVRNLDVVLSTKNHIRIKVALMGVCVVFNIILNILLIPDHGAFGAAIATIVSVILNLLAFRLYTWRYVFADFK